MISNDQAMILILIIKLVTFYNHLAGNILYTYTLNFQNGFNFTVKNLIGVYCGCYKHITSSAEYSLAFF